MYLFRRMSNYRGSLDFRIPKFVFSRTSVIDFDASSCYARSNPIIMLPQGRTSSTNTTNPPSCSTRSSSSDTHWKSCNHHDQQLLFQKLASMGYTNPNVCEGMIKALESIYGVGKVNEATLSKFGSSALQVLSESVKREQQSSKLNFVGVVHFVVKHHNFSFDLPCKEGESLMMLAKSPLGQELLAEYLECACGDQDTYDKLDPPTTAELDMLDLAFEPTPTSRLGCQIKMRPELDGMTITIPSGVNNFWS